MDDSGELSSYKGMGIEFCARRRQNNETDCMGEEPKIGSGIL